MRKKISEFFWRILDKRKRSAEAELEFQAENDFTFKYYQGDIYSQDYWKKTRASFPQCPHCLDNKDVKIVSYGLQAGPIPAWFRHYVLVRGCIRRGPERWTCSSCQKDFFGHKAEATKEMRS